MEERDYILFEAYLSGVISPEEKEKLKMRLEKDGELKASFELYKETSAHLENRFGKEKDTMAFREKVSGISEAYFRDAPGRKKGLRKLRPWQMVAAAGVLVILGIFLSRRMSVPSYDDYAGYPEISLAVRGESNTVLLQAETAFNNGDYGEAATLLGEIVKGGNTNPEIQLYRAISLVELNRFGEADAVLDRLMDSGSVIRYDAMWYAALSKLKQKDFSASADILERIPESADRYKRAQKLLKRLE